MDLPRVLFYYFFIDKKIHTIFENFGILKFGKKNFIGIFNIFILPNIILCNNYNKIKNHEFIFD